jgi:choice-of-anchor B domain-containing protein
MNSKLVTFLIMVIIIPASLAQDSISLIGKLNYSGIPVHDINRYVDSATNIPYALLCASTSGMRVINISDPANPVQTGTISGGGVNVVDVGTFKQYAYTVAENISSTSGKIIDLTNPAAPVKVGTFSGAHTVYVTPNGYMYLESPGLRIYDLNPNPLNPQLVYNSPTCTGHDVTIAGNRLYDFSDNCGTRIYDLSQPDTLVLLGQIPSLGIFHHSGYPSADGNYLFVCDELSSPTENDITIWDISNLSSPILVDSFADPSAYIHNFYIIGNYAYVSYYRNGFRVFDVSDPLNIFLVDEYDTDTTLSGPGYGGNYGLYVFSPDGNILASDENNGLYIFKFSGLQTAIKEEQNLISNVKVFPNPAKNIINISLENIDTFSTMEIKIYNLTGKLIYSETVGSREAVINSTGWSSGLYTLLIQQNKRNIRKKIIID